MIPTYKFLYGNQDNPPFFFGGTTLPYPVDTTPTNNSGLAAFTNAVMLSRLLQIAIFPPTGIVTRKTVAATGSTFELSATMHLNWPLCDGNPPTSQVPTCVTYQPNGIVLEPDTLVTAAPMGCFITDADFVKMQKLAGMYIPTCFSDSNARTVFGHNLLSPGVARDYVVYREGLCGTQKDCYTVNDKPNCEPNIILVALGPVYIYEYSYDNMVEKYSCNSYAVTANVYLIFDDANVLHSGVYRFVYQPAKATSGIWATTAYYQAATEEYVRGPVYANWWASVSHPINVVVLNPPRVVPDTGFFNDGDRLRVRIVLPYFFDDYADQYALADGQLGMRVAYRASDIINYTYPTGDASAWPQFSGNPQVEAQRLSYRIACYFGDREHDISADIDSSEVQRASAAGGDGVVTFYTTMKKEYDGTTMICIVTTRFYLESFAYMNPMLAAYATLRYDKLKYDTLCCKIYQNGLWSSDPTGGHSRYLVAPDRRDFYMPGHPHQPYQYTHTQSNIAFVRYPPKPEPPPPEVYTAFLNQIAPPPPIAPTDSPAPVLPHFPPRGAGAGQTLLGTPGGLTLQACVLQYLLPVAFCTCVGVTAPDGWNTRHYQTFVVHGQPVVGYSACDSPPTDCVIDALPIDWWYSREVGYGQLTTNPTVTFTVVARLRDVATTPRAKTYGLALLFNFNNGAFDTRVQYLCLPFYNVNTMPGKGGVDDRGRCCFYNNVFAFPFNMPCDAMIAGSMRSTASGLVGVYNWGAAVNNTDYTLWTANSADYSLIAVLVHSQPYVYEDGTICVWLDAVTDDCLPAGNGSSVMPAIALGQFKVAVDLFASSGTDYSGLVAAANYMDLVQQVNIVLQSSLAQMTASYESILQLSMLVGINRARVYNGDSCFAPDSIYQALNYTTLSIGSALTEVIGSGGDPQQRAIDNALAADYAFMSLTAELLAAEYELYALEYRIGELGRRVTTVREELTFKLAYYDNVVSAQRQLRDDMSLYADSMNVLATQLQELRAAYDAFQQSYIAWQALICGRQKAAFLTRLFIQTLVVPVIGIVNLLLVWRGTIHALAGGANALSAFALVYFVGDVIYKAVLLIDAQQFADFGQKFC